MNMSAGKRKNRWKKFAFEDSNDTFKSDEIHISPIKDPNDFLPKPKFNFEKEITPKTVDDLAIHVKKINDVECWLNVNVVTPTKKKSILLITGPTGCGKTVTVKVLCKKLNIEVNEWINPIDNKDRDYSIGQTNQLIEFIAQSKYPSLFNSVDKPKITLVEDFPNSVIHNNSEFTSVLEKCYDSNSCVVFICTDGNSNLNLSQTLFPQETRDKFSIYNIAFNATANTLLKKALKQAQSLVEKHEDIFNIPDQNIIDSIVTSCMGDLRCAISQYYFASLKESNDTSKLKSTKLGQKRKRNAKNNTTKIENMMKTERLSFFHGLGRVLNPKREVANESWRLTCDINALVEELGIQPTTFNSFIHANYLKYFGDVNDISNAADILSLSQNYLSKWDCRTELLKYGLWITIMGLMVHNEHRVSKWNQINAPRKFNKIKNNDIETRHLSAIDKFYYNNIKKCDINNRFKLNF